MKKYKTPNGQIVDESVLRNKYGDRFDSLVSNGTFTLESDVPLNGQRSGKYQVPSGELIDESVLRNKYGGRFDELVGNGTIKKKDGGAASDTITASNGQSVSNGPLKGESKPGLSKEDETNIKTYIQQQKSPFELEEEKLNRETDLKNAVAKINPLLRTNLSLAEKNEKPVKYPMAPVPDKPEEEDVELNIKGNLFKISPKVTPAEYGNTIEGAKKYANDLFIRIRDNRDSNDLRELYSVVGLSRATKNKAVISEDDVFKINKYLENGDFSKGVNENTPFVATKMSPETLARLKQKREEVSRRFEQIQQPRHPRHPSKEALAAEGKEYDAVKAELAFLDSYILRDKLSKQKEETGLGSSINTLGADTRTDLDKFFDGMGKDIKEYKSRLGTEATTNAFATGLESKRLTDPAEYKIEKKRLLEGKTLSSAKVYEYTQIGAEIIDARNLEEFARGEKTLEQFSDKSAEINKQVTENVYGRRDILEKYVATIVGEYYADEGTLVFGKWQINDKKIDVVPADYFIRNGLDPSRPEFKEAIAALKKKEGWLPFDNAIPKDALARDFARGFFQPIKGTADFLGGIGVGDNTKRIEGELQHITNYEKQRTKYYEEHYGMLADAVSGAGQFVSQYLLMEAGAGVVGGLGKSLQGAKLLNTEFGVVNTGIRSEIGAGILKSKDVISTIAIPYISTYDANLKHALTLTDDPVAARFSASANSLMEGLSERMFNNLDFGRAAVKNFRNKLDLSMDKVTSILGKAGAQSELKEVVENTFRAATKEVAKASKGLVMESVEEMPVAFAQFFTDAMLDPNSIKDRSVMNEVVDAFKASLVSFSIPSIIGLGGSLRKQFTNPTTEADGLMIAARNRVDVLDAIKTEQEDGKITQEEANHKIKVLNTATVSLLEIPKTYANDGRMSEEDKVKYLSLSVREKFLKEENDKIKDEAVQKVNEEKIKELSKQKVEILTQNKFDADEAIVVEAKHGRLPGMYNSIVNSNPDVARQVLNEFAQQKYGVTADGKINPIGPSQISNSVVDAAVTEIFPDKKALVRSIHENKALGRPTEIETADAIGVAKDGNKEVFAELFKVAQKEYNFANQNSEEVVAAAYHKMIAIAPEQRTEKQSQFIADVDGLLAVPLQNAEEVVPVSKEEAKAPDAGITVGEMLDRKGSYKGVNGIFYRYGGQVVFKGDDGKYYNLGKLEDVSNRAIDDFGIEHQESVVSIGEDGSLVVRGEKLTNNYSDPLAAINKTKKGYTVTLENANGKKRTFRGSVGEDLAYQINLQQIRQQQNEKESFEQFISSDPEVNESIQDGGHTETTTEDTALADGKIPGVKTTEEVERTEEDVENILGQKLPRGFGSKHSPVDVLDPVTGLPIANQGKPGKPVSAVAALRLLKERYETCKKLLKCV